MLLPELRGLGALSIGVVVARGVEVLLESRHVRLDGEGFVVVQLEGSAGLTRAREVRGEGADEGGEGFLEGGEGGGVSLDR